MLLKLLKVILIMMTNDFERELNLLDNEICSGFDILINSIVVTSINSFMDILNSQLKNPLKSFIIRGSTPSFNDGDPCYHKSEYALPHVAKNANGNIYINDLIDYYEEYYKLIFKNSGIDLNAYPESHYLVKAVENGLIPEIRAYSNADEQGMILITISKIEKVLEKLLNTNYLVVYDVNNDVKISVSKYDPEY